MPYIVKSRGVLLRGVIDIDLDQKTQQKLLDVSLEVKNGGFIGFCELIDTKIHKGFIL